MSECERFVAEFTEFWKAPTVARMGELFHPGIVLIQPLSHPLRGKEKALAGFAKIFARFPDLHAEVDRWGGTPEGLYIEFRLRTHLGGELVEWPVIDRFVIRNGKALERVSYFDALPLVGKILKHPGTWWRLARAGHNGI